MSNEKKMKEFIEAFVEQYGFGRMTASSNPDAAAMLACAEWAWFKSRAAIEIELPSSARMYFNGAPSEAYTDGIQCWHGGVDAARRAIESLGLKVKP